MREGGPSCAITPFDIGSSPGSPARGASPAEMLMARSIPEPNSGCWIWTGGKFGNGYGAVSLDGRHMPAHRASYMVNVGPIPEGLWVLHRCDNPPCINPAHLWVGTHSDNAKDCYAKGRGARNERRKLSPEIVSLLRRTLPTTRRTAFYRENAALYGVAMSTIRYRARGFISWRRPTC